MYFWLEVSLMFSAEGMKIKFSCFVWVSTFEGKNWFLLTLWNSFALALFWARTSSCFAFSSLCCFTSANCLYNLEEMCMELNGINGQTLKANEQQNPYLSALWWVRACLAFLSSGRGARTLFTPFRRLRDEPESKRLIKGLVLGHINIPNTCCQSHAYLFEGVESYSSFLFVFGRIAPYMCFSFSLMWL